MDRFWLRGGAVCEDCAAPADRNARQGAGPRSPGDQAHRVRGEVGRALGRCSDHAMSEFSRRVLVTGAAGFLHRTDVGAGPRSLLRAAERSRLQEVRLRASVSHAHREDHDRSWQGCAQGNGGESLHMARSTRTTLESAVSNAVLPDLNPKK